MCRSFLLLYLSISFYFSPFLHQFRVRLRRFRFFVLTRRSQQKGLSHSLGQSVRSLSLSFFVVPAWKVSKAHRLLISQLSNLFVSPQPSLSLLYRRFSSEWCRANLRYRVILWFSLSKDITVKDRESSCSLLKVGKKVEGRNGICIQ